MIRYPEAEKRRDGDPAFILTRAEAEELAAEEPSIYLPPDVKTFFLCDGVLLWGDLQANVFWDGENSRATWFEQDRFMGRRPIIYVEEQ